MLDSGESGGRSEVGESVVESQGVRMAGVVLLLGFEVLETGDERVLGRVCSWPVGSINRDRIQTPWYVFALS